MDGGNHLDGRWVEAERLAALLDYGIMDTAPEVEFDSLVAVAARICGTPRAAVSLIDETRQWFKAGVGLPVSEAPRDTSFCTHAIQERELMVVPDATRDPRFSTNPMVIGELGFRFYAGAVLNTPAGMPLGTLCVVDSVARPDGLSADQALMLKALARQVVSLLELRRALARAKAAEARLRLAFQAGLVGWWDWDVNAGRVYLDDNFASLFGMTQTADGVDRDDLLARIHPDDRAWIARAMTKASRDGGEFAEEHRLVRASGETVWVLARGRRHDTDAGPRLPGVIIDITARKAAEEALRDSDVGRELALQAARLGRWDHHPEAGLRFYDARAREILGLGPDDQIGVAGMLETVHSEDRASLAEALARSSDPNRTGPMAATFRIHRRNDGAVRWLSATGRSFFDNGRCVRFVGVLEDVTDKKRAEEYQRLLTNELNHRVKNTLAMAQAVVSQTLRSAASPDEARSAVAERLSVLGRAHDILTRTSWSGAPIKEVVASATAALALGAGRIHAEGPALELGPKPALSLTLVLHELGANALKYGALSNLDGRVHVTWTVEANPAGARLRLLWRETGGPEVIAPSRRGFGSRLIEQAVASDFAGEVRLSFAPAGVSWSLDAPLAAMQAS